MGNTNKQIIQLDNVHFAWPGASRPVVSIENFGINYGERVFLKGPSGSGKTTLLSLIAAVLVPQSGGIVVDGVALNTLRGGQKDQFRVDRIGLVFQQFNLLPFLSVQENIQLPCRFSAQRRKRACEGGFNTTMEAKRLLQAMQLPVADLLDTPVTNLSVGQQQRVAVARALIGRPPLIIADEPTSALDSDTRQAFLDLLFAEIEAAGCSLLFVSHDASLAGHFDRRMDLREINTATDISEQQSMRS
ncbi:methionine ABC transporter ATP-binding protein [Chromatiales bacterium (ex Bugula neritina AB1)]|nr:methionine ABC transporter ATP-binding protein [Chromatiales bacterium (ex Bugula neritina AB1)]